MYYTPLFTECAKGDAKTTNGPLKDCKHKCKHCEKGFTRKYNLQRHTARCHAEGSSTKTHPSSSQQESKEGGCEIEPDQMFTLEKRIGTYNKKFGVNEVHYICRFREETYGQDVLQTLLCTLNTILDQVLSEISDSAMVQLSMVAPTELDYPIVLPFLDKDMITIDVLLTYISKVLQSYKEFRLWPNVIIKLASVENKKTKGYSIKSCFQSWAKTSRSIIKTPNNGSNDCFLEAIVLGLAYSISQLFIKCKGDVTKIPTWLQDYGLQILWNSRSHIKILRNDRKLKHIVKIVQQVCGIGRGGVSVSNYHKIQDKFLARVGYRLQVFNMRHPNGLSYSTPPLSDTDPGENVYIYVKEEHAYTITKICGFLQIMFFCPYCLMSARHIRLHKCQIVCYRCGLKGGSVDCTGVLVFCSDCNKYFQGPTCLERHKENGICSKEKYCPLCCSYVHKSKKTGKMTHRCGFKRCNICKCNYDISIPHKCFIQPLWSEDDNSQEFTYIAFDVESMLQRDFSKVAMEHVVCCVCSTIVCNMCIDNYPASHS